MNFSPSFHLLLKRLSEQTGKPMGDLIEEKLTPLLTEQDSVQLKRQYEGLFALAGMVKAHMPDASATVDDVLYGDSQEAHD